MRRAYEDDYDDEEEENKPDAKPREAAPVSSLDKLDYLLALCLGFFSVALLTVWSFPGLSPDVWDEAAVAAGLRPTVAIFPGFWRVIARGFYSINGVGLGNVLLIWVGRVALGLTVGFAYLLFRSILSLTIRRRLNYARRRFVVVRGTAMLGAIAFLCADPIWHVGQAFSPSGLLLLVSVFSLYQFFSFLQHGQLREVNISMFLLGMLAAETPMGFVLTAVCWGVYFLALRYAAVSMGMALLDPIVAQRSKWHLTFLWAMGLILGIAGNCASFVWLDGLAASGASGGDVPLMYATRWWTQFIGAASGLGWVLGLGICVLPLIVCGVLLPRAVDEEQFLPYHMGAVFFVTGALALAQLAELSPLWFWRWHDDIVVKPYFLQMLILLSSMTLVFALAVMGVDAACRDHERLANERFANLNDDDDDDMQMSRRVQTSGHSSHGNIVIVVVPILLLAAVVPGRWQRTTRQVLRMVEDYLNEVIVECGPAHWLFTDGSPFDPRFELASAEQGKKVRVLSMRSKLIPYDQYICQHGYGDLDAEDVLALQMGVPSLLRSWVRKPERMKDAAVQVGFEMWKDREGLEVPLCSGVLSRPLGMSLEDCAAGVARTKEISSRILKFYEDGGNTQRLGTSVKNLLLFVQWRIARIAVMRDKRAGRVGNPLAGIMGMKEGEIKDGALAKKLDAFNEAVKNIQASMERARAKALNAVTPREGLQKALERRDFVTAQNYATPILKVRPNDRNALFGLAMFYYTQGQFARAEEQFNAYLKCYPKEPAAWNNLAIIKLKTGRLEEAERDAQKALDLIPESAEVKDTLKDIRDARKEAAKEADKNKKGKGKKDGKAKKK